ncbi:hypothetical protein IFM89_008932 [Coptis chinensis]|uniref:DUF7788 domain-containing protein n=1 Tax=Coptis chinensis TaxID=261450 RepID=A0A835HY63_9MAGN|nr:hypothetical protein IFM89_008932 [Coptis chinensis]
MVKKVFVFSDMEFDEASPNALETDYEAIIRKFSGEGMVRLYRTLFSGISRFKIHTIAWQHKKELHLLVDIQKLVNVVPGDDGQLNPRLIMESAISGEEYKKLAVFD